MLRFFEHPLSPYARKVEIVLEHKGVPYRPVFVNPMAAEDDPTLREFLAASPRREVPCLVDEDDGTAVFDSTVMLDPITGSAFFGIPLDAKHERVAAWAARCAEQPAVRADAEQLGAWMRDNLGGGGGGTQSAMPIVRQYRDHRLEWMMKSGGIEVVRRGLAAGSGVAGGAGLGGDDRLGIRRRPGQRPESLQQMRLGSVRLGSVRVLHLEVRGDQRPVRGAAERQGVGGPAGTVQLEHGQ